MINDAHIAPEARMLAAGATILPRPALDAADGLSELAEPMAAPEFSDDALAIEFSERHDGQLVYVAEWNQWRRWDGSRWAADNTLAVFDLARGVTREAAAVALASGGEKQKQAAIIASARTVAAVERLARYDRRHARASDDFDADPFALNTPGGVVDLRTGQMRPHRKTDLFTKVAGVAPGGSCPRFIDFLAQITSNDEALMGYLQRFFGYCLTGETREHEFLIAQGPGGNGKSVLFNTLALAMGDYATTADMSLFTVGKHEQHPAGLADLRGARLVITQETEAGARLAEARIKQLTGGDRVKARFMAQNWFEFTPRFKLVIVGNHRPVIHNPDAAMRRRLRLVPFNYVPPKPDRTLQDKLLQELPGILAWAIAGCLEWQRREALAAPQTVVHASSGYFDEQDLLGQWIAEACEVKPGAECPSRTLFNHWRAWTKARGEEPRTETAFSTQLQNRFVKKRTNRGHIFTGLRLTAAAVTGADLSDGS